MTSTQRVWLSPQAYERLQEELTALRELSNNTRAADDDTSDSDENVAAIQRARHARIQQLHELLTKAVVGEDPPDDGIAEPGMVLTVRYNDTDETETFLLGTRGAEYGDIEVYSIDSPLGAAIAGARPGEERTYRLPSGEPLTVTLVTAVPYGLHTPHSN